MAVRGNAIHKPDSVTVSVTLAMVVGGGTLAGLFYLSAPLLDPTASDWFTAVVIALTVVQVITGVLLLVGARRFSTGAGRGTLFAGGALEFLLCAVYGWYAVTAVAGDPQDGGVFFLFIGVPCGAAAVMASSLLLALRPSATAYVIARGSPGDFVRK